VPPVAAVAAADTSPVSDKAQQDDPVERRIWIDGLRLMSFSGLSEKHARPLLGRLAKDYTKHLLAECIAVTQAENPADPKAFLIKTLKQRSRKPGKIGEWDGEEKPVEITACPRCGDECCLGGRSCEMRASALGRGKAAA
jgi:hypothetical protein